MRVAIVGAGVAGLACAHGLAARGGAPVVFERADEPGGRVATERTEIGGFDHGAQYLTARDDAFVAEVARWQAAGVVAPWPVRPGSVAAVAGDALVLRSIDASQAPGARWVGVPGMAAIATHLADGIDVRYGTSIAALARDPAEGWTLRDATGAAIGPFDAVVVAVPAEDAVPLLAATPTIAARAAGVRIDPCWAAMLGFAEPIGIDEAAVGDAAFVAGGRLAWIARDSAKPGRRAGERWTVHARADWSIEHFDDDPADVATKLLHAFHDATGSAAQPILVHLVRWRHALARRALDVGCLWDDAARLGACGDWCRGHRVEDAWLSGTAMAAAIGPD